MATQRALHPELPAPPAVPDRAPAFSDESLLLLDAPVPGPAREAPAPPDAQLQIEVAADPAALEQAWLELAEHAAEPNPFYEPWMLLPALRAFGEGRVRVVTFWAEGRGREPRRLAGLCPILWHRGRAEPWRYPSCALSAPLFRRGWERPAAAAFLDFLQSTAKAVRLDDVPGDGPVHLALIDELYRRGWPALVTQRYTRAVLRRKASAAEYLAMALAGKRRKELRRQRTRLSELGALEVSELEPGEDPRPWLEEFLTLERSGWKGRKGVAAAASEAYRSFFEESVVRAAARGRARMLALRLDGRAVALKLNLYSGEAGFAFKIAYDEEYARFSPGVLLELEHVERAHRPGEARWVDSCAAPNRFMINHLWPDRRELQTVFLSTGSRRGALYVALTPILQFIRSLLPRRKRA